MKMTELLRYGIPLEIIQLWGEQESETLLPVQAMAVKRHGLFDGGNLLIQAPTSSGKTFIGEMAALQTALRRKKVLYLVPLKALAEEKWVDFRDKYAPYGVKVIISTRDHRDFDPALEAGDFSIAVIVYEKLAQLLVRRPERLEEVELVVADELEILSDPDRGALVELMLTRVLLTGCRMVGLSAVIGEADRLAKWLNAELVMHERRPLELRYGVLHDGVFRYRTYNEFSEGEEPLVNAYSDSAWETLMQNAREFAGRGESCLVFVKARHESRRGAELLAQEVQLPAATGAIERLRELETTHSREILLETLSHGVAFHNSDLSQEERHVVEVAFRAGEIGVLVSTNTLAVGMNLPARNVFIAPEKWQYDSRFGMPWKTPILHSEYENMGGRAGRYGSGQDFGRSILIGATQFDYETLWRRYVEGQRERIEPRLSRAPLENHVLRLVASHACENEDAVRAFFEATLTGKWVWAETLSSEEVAFHVRAAVNRAVDAGMIARAASGQLEATPFGQAVSAKGISIATAQELAAWLRVSETRQWIPLDLLLAAAMTPDGRMLQVTLTSHEYEHADYPGLLKKAAKEEDITVDVPMNRLRNCNLRPFFEEVRAIKVALALCEWLDEAGIYDLEETYRMLMGQLIGAADQLSWLIDATAAIAGAFGAKDRLIEQLQRLAFRVQRGIRDDAVALAQAHPQLTRAKLLALESRRLHTPEALAHAHETLLNQWLTPDETKAVKAWARRLVHNAPSSAPAIPEPPVLVIDDRRPGEILLEGKAIAVQDKQYRLLNALAAAPSDCVPYDSIYTAVWGEAVVEPNQMHFQKRQLLARIVAELPHRAELITTVPKRGFVLNLTPAQVQVTRVNGVAKVASG